MPRSTSNQTLAFIQTLNISRKSINSAIDSAILWLKWTEDGPEEWEQERDHADIVVHKVKCSQYAETTSKNLEEAIHKLMYVLDPAFAPLQEVSDPSYVPSIAAHNLPAMQMPNRPSNLSVTQIYTQDPHHDMTHAEVLHQNEQLQQRIHALKSNVGVQRDDVVSLGRALLRARDFQNDDEAMLRHRLPSEALSNKVMERLLKNVVFVGRRSKKRKAMNRKLEEQAANRVKIEAGRADGAVAQTPESMVDDV